MRQADIEFSVIIPVYNTAQYLEQCLTAVLRQDFTNFEIIAVNDASTDRSADILALFQSLDNRIKVIEHDENQGLPSARNSGVAAASGKYVIHLDSDDFWHSRQVLKTLYQVFESDNCEILRFNGRVLKNGKLRKKIIGDSNFVNCTLRDSKSLVQFRAVYLYCFRKSFLDEHSLEFDPEISIGEDGIFLSKALAKAKRISSIPDHFYRYRMSASSLMRKKWTLENFLEELTSSQIIYRTLEDYPEHQRQITSQRMNVYLPLRLATRAREDLNAADRKKYFEAIQKNARQQGADDPSLRSSLTFTGRVFNFFADRNWPLGFVAVLGLASPFLHLLPPLKRQAKRIEQRYKFLSLLPANFIKQKIASLRWRFAPAKDRVFRNLEGHKSFDFTLSIAITKPGSSAMLRVKNEADNITACLTSIADCFDEIVVVDNASDDTTVEKIKEFQATHPQGQKVVLHHYPFKVARCGSEHQATDANSVHSLSYFYNWCLSNCHRRTVTKWDGDMQMSHDKPSKKQFSKLLMRVGKGNVPSYASFLVQTVYRDPQKVYWVSETEKIGEIRVLYNHPDVYFRKGDMFETIKIHPGTKVKRLRKVVAFEIKDLAEQEFDHWTSLSFSSQRKATEYRNYRYFKLGFIKAGSAEFSVKTDLTE
ncbi:glycosyltransferase [Alphaproteobacteria bacterium]|nr:glycosyltransferase [Alphaproteobacteria bacterium]